MKIEDILDLEPLLVDPKSGHEPSLRKLVERYYKEYFPETFNFFVEGYIRELENILDKGKE